jgi:DNA-binding LytR/AlgR family response regulator
MTQSADHPRAMIAEDEPVLVASLTRMLSELWPQLQVIAVAEDGAAAITQALLSTPDIMFLDIKMPGPNGLQVAETVADEWPNDKPEPLFVFVTAHDEFAVSAFERAAIDYLLKPVTAERLETTVVRLQARLAARAATPAAGEMASLFRLVQSISAPKGASADRIRVIRASVGAVVRMIPVDEVICLEAADKYVNVITREGESLVRMSLRDLLSRIEGAEFVQVHRAAAVNAKYMASAMRDEFGHFTLSLRGLSKTLKVSRAFSHLFRPM